MRLDETGGRDTTFLLRFHGVRGSFPVPGPDCVHFGGNTSCVEVEAGDLRVMLDIGTGAIPLGRRLAAQSAASGEPTQLLLLISHVHHDHTMGFPFFEPAYDARARLHLHGPGSPPRDFREVFEGAFEHPFFPVAPKDLPAQRTFGTLADGDVLAWESLDRAPRLVDGTDGLGPDALVVRAFRNRNHPNGGVLNFRLDRGGKSIVMATDVEGTAGEGGDLVDFARGADVLIHDAQYTDREYEEAKQGWGHSTWRMAADVAWRSQARRLVLYHHDPVHDDQAVEDIEKKAREVFPRCIAACEGLEIRL